MAKAIPDFAIEVRDVSDEIAALREAVEVLEDRYAAAVTANAHWIRMFLSTADERDAALEAVEVLESMEDNARKDLQTSIEDSGKLLSIQGRRIGQLRERIRTYKAALQEIAGDYDVRTGPYNGPQNFAYHVLNSRIDDGGSDF